MIRGEVIEYFLADDNTRHMQVPNPSLDTRSHVTSPSGTLDLSLQPITTSTSISPRNTKCIRLRNYPRKALRTRPFLICFFHFLFLHTWLIFSVSQASAAVCRKKTRKPVLSCVSCVMIYISPSSRRFRHPTNIRRNLISPLRMLQPCTEKKKNKYIFLY